MLHIPEIKKWKLKLISRNSEYERIKNRKSEIEIKINLNYV